MTTNWNDYNAKGRDFQKQVKAVKLAAQQGSKLLHDFAATIKKRDEGGAKKAHEALGKIFRMVPSERPAERPAEPTRMRAVPTPAVVKSDPRLPKVMTALSAFVIAMPKLIEFTRAGKQDEALSIVVMLKRQIDSLQQMFPLPATPASIPEHKDMSSTYCG